MSKSIGNPLESSSPPSARRQRKAGRRAGVWRHRRQPEPWEADHEPYPAATILADLDKIGDDVGAAATILARFAVLQLVLLATSGVTTGEALAEDRELALSYLVDPAGCGAAERETLSAALALADAEPGPALATALAGAGAQAETRGHDAGAWGCYRTAYLLARVHGWPAEGAGAARALAALAAGVGGTHSARLWERRAQSLDLLGSEPVAR